MPWLRLHGAALAGAVRRLGARPIESALTLLVLGMAIALPVLAGIALRSVEAATARLDTDPHLDLFLALDATDEEVGAVRKALQSHARVAAVEFIPRERALAELKATTHLAEILAALERNPLPHAFSVRARSDPSADPDALKAELEKLPKVEQVTADFEWSRRLAGWVRFGNRVLGLVAVGLALAVALIVGHLVRLQVLTRKAEIEVSQLLGATRADVRRPFLYHGALQAILSAGIGVALAFAIAAWIGSQLLALTSGYGDELKVVFVALEQVAVVLAAAAALGLAGAWIAVNRELRQFSRP